MKRFLLIGVLLLALMACTHDNIDKLRANVVESTDTFSVGFESVNDTRVQLNDNLKTVWTEGDLVSVFDKTYDNKKYKYEGKTGATSGSITLVDDQNGNGAVVSNKKIVLYPYNENYKVLYERGYVETFLPTIQAYMPNSYGLDGSVMIGVSTSNDFIMRNACGWLCVELTGEGEHVRSIQIYGNNEEQLSGFAYISIDDAKIVCDSLNENSDPEESSLDGLLSRSRYQTVVLDCGENGVELTNESKPFYIALPPQNYSGFTVRIDYTDSEPTYLKTTGAIEIKRNYVCPMESLSYTEAINKSCLFTLDKIHELMSTPTTIYDHSDYGYPSICVHHDHACMLISVNGWMRGINQYYSRFQAAHYALGYNTDGGVSEYYWLTYHRILDLCNQILRCGIDNNLDAYIRGIARTYRAMLYIDMARLYECLPADAPNSPNYASEQLMVAGLTVPIEDEYLDEEGAANNPRATRAELFDFILNDLALAEKELENYSPTAYYMPDLSVVYGLYARAYLWLGGFTDGLSGKFEDGTSREGYAAYAKAAEYARMAINQCGGAIMTEDEWTDVTTGFNTKVSSWMWAIDCGYNNNLLHNAAHMAPEATYGYAILTHPGISATSYYRLHDTDFRKKLIINPDNSSWNEFEPYTSISEDEFYNYAPYTFFKFRPANGERIDYHLAGQTTYPLMRTEEMYFIEMEATAHYDEAAAQNMLKSFMANRDTDYYGTITGDLVDEIIFQKGIEFWGEGILMYDMKRLNMSVNTYDAGNYPEGVRYISNGRLPWWTCCIPISETKKNKAISHPNPDPSGSVPSL